MGCIFSTPETDEERRRRERKERRFKSTAAHMQLGPGGATGGTQPSTTAAFDGLDAIVVQADEDSRASSQRGTFGFSTPKVSQAARFMLGGGGSARDGEDDDDHEFEGSADSRSVMSNHRQMTPAKSSLREPSAAGAANARPMMNVSFADDTINAVTLGGDEPRNTTLSPRALPQAAAKGLPPQQPVARTAPGRGNPLGLMTGPVPDDMEPWPTQSPPQSDSPRSGERRASGAEPELGGRSPSPAMNVGVPEQGEAGDGGEVLGFEGLEPPDGGGGPVPAQHAE
jgi:hypothetical protein